MPSNIVRSLRARTDRVTIGAQGLVIDGDQRVLLVRHGYRPGWHFPGGGVERGEPVLTALARELLEETGVILGGAAKLVGLYTNFVLFPGDHVALFEVRDWRRDAIPAPNVEIAECRLFALDDIPNDIAPGPARRLAEIYGGKPQSETW